MPAGAVLLAVTATYSLALLAWLVIRLHRTPLSAAAALADREVGARGAAAAHLVTIAWFYVTSMLFLHGGNRALPWFGCYAGEPWLP